MGERGLEWRWGRDERGEREGERDLVEERGKDGVGGRDRD